MCENCGEVLEVPVAAKTVSPAKTPTAASKAPGIEGRACALVENNKATANEFELPADDFSFSVGRTDLDQGIIPDVDLIKFAQKVTVGAETGYTVSRKQAIISRRMGKLFLKSLGSAKTMVKTSQDDWKELKKDEEMEVHATYRFRFGGSEGYVIFEVV